MRVIPVDMSGVTAMVAQPPQPKMKDRKNGVIAVRAALIYQHSNLERQREVAGGIDARVRAEREKAADVPDEQASGTERARDV